LAPLPDTATELKTIAGILGMQNSNLFLHEQATEQNFRLQSLKEYRVLYFATHGLLPGELKCQSEPGLVLTPPAGQATKKDNDGLLEASEIATFKLDADMVVLSACNTAGGGGKFGGEALSGLAESFFFAGARSLVVSHWQVPSAATAKLMSGMFSSLGPELKGGSAHALQLAQAKLIAKPETAHPFFWAAFVIVGDGMAASSAELLAQVPAVVPAATAAPATSSAPGATLAPGVALTPAPAAPNTQSPPSAPVATAPGTTAPGATKQ
jgi:CHAT domain-containing protein